MTYLEYEGIWRAMLFREHVLSDVLPHLHNKNDKVHKLFFTSPQNSTFSLTIIEQEVAPESNGGKNLDIHPILSLSLSLSLSTLFFSSPSVTGMPPRYKAGRLTSASLLNAVTW